MKQRAQRRWSSRPVAPVAVATALLIAGCALQPAPKPEDTRSQAMGATDVTTPWRAGDGNTATVQDNWLTTFNDAQLNALVAEAVQRNPDLRVAATEATFAIPAVIPACSSTFPESYARATSDTSEKTMASPCALMRSRVA